MRWVYTYLYTIEMHVLDRFLPSSFPFGNYLLSFKQAMISSIYRLPAYCVLKSLQFFFFDPKVINFIHEMGMKKKTFPSIVAQAKMSKRRKEKSKTRKENVESVCFFFSFILLFIQATSFFTLDAIDVFFYLVCVCAGFVSNVREKHLPFLKWLWLLFLFLLHTNDWSYFLKVTNISKATATPSLCAAQRRHQTQIHDTQHIFAPS